MDPFKQLRFAILAVILLICLGTVGFVYIEGLSLLNALYMTIITITTVGLEVVKPLTPAGKVFTMVLSMSGVFILFTVVFSAIINAIETAASQNLQHLFWRRRMEKSIKNLKGHYIICGYGRMGQAIAGEFCARNVPFIVIENNPEQMPRLLAEQIPFVEGDASDEKTLLAAGVDRAKGLITVAPTDADNTFIALSAKGINPRLFIVARSIKTEDEPKLRRAGADRVISPYILGGKRMAWAVLRPAVVDFLDNALFSESLELEIAQVTVSDKAEFVNKAIRDSGIRDKSGVMVIAIKTRGGAYISNPPADTKIHEGDTLIIVGNSRQLETLKSMA